MSVEKVLFGETLVCVGSEMTSRGATETQASNGDERNDGMVAVRSSKWRSDDAYTACCACKAPFSNPLTRRHHCRLCGEVFCQKCSGRRALIPPSSIVLTPRGGKRVSEKSRTVEALGFEAEEDPDRLVTLLRPSQQRSDNYRHDDRLDDADISDLARQPIQDSSSLTSGNSNDLLLYGKGLEERTKLAREPLRVCAFCYEQLLYVQEELRASNSNAVRHNAVDPTDVRRLFNSPLAFTLGHEVRKAAYTLNNLLPLPKRMGAFVSTHNETLSGAYSINATTDQLCKDTCSGMATNFGNLDGVRIPARLMEQAKGVAVMTVVKGGIGFAGFEFGTGLVVARLADGRGWSPPCAIGTAGVSWGALLGAQVSDHVFLLMTDAAVDMMSSNDGSFQLGADIGVAVGPLGRSVEADIGAAAGNIGGNGSGGGLAVAPIYTYSLSKGLYAGISLDGKVIITRHRVNEKFYGQEVDARALLNGDIATPPAAQPLYDALKRCHVYATSLTRGQASRASGDTNGAISQKNAYNMASMLPSHHGTTVAAPLPDGQTQNFKMSPNHQRAQY